MTQEDKERYVAAMHGVQSGVAMKMNWDTKETEPKSLRVGVNSALVDFSALQKLLIDKGIITEDELYSALADMAELEVASYEDEINSHYNTNWTIELK